MTVSAGNESPKVLKASTGVAVPLGAGEALRVVNTHGTQVVDTWALVAADTAEILSVEHTRRMLGKLHATVGDKFWSNRRREILVFEEDSSPGIHDMLIAPCDPWGYEYFGASPDHPSCRNNYLAALAAIGVDATWVPNPLNLWMNVPVEAGALRLDAPVSRPGDHVVLRALLDVVIVMSACPWDLTPVNGAACTPCDVSYARVPADPMR